LCRNGMSTIQQRVKASIEMLGGQSSIINQNLK